MLSWLLGPITMKQGVWHDFFPSTGLSQPKPLQLDSMDGELRTSLWNALCEHFFWQPDMMRDIMSFPSDALRDLCIAIWRDHFKQSVYELQSWWGAYTIIHKNFEGASWNAVYDFVQFIVTEAHQTDWNWDVADFEVACNEVLERERSGYRFLNGILVPITNESELWTVSTAMSSPLGPVAEHVRKATEHFANRTNPDHRNSIKESISAIESMCKLVAKMPKASLKDAMDTLESKGVQLHGALKSGFQSLYGFASDESGIRHALLDEPNVQPEDAMFMLVSCSCSSHVQHS